MLTSTLSFSWSSLISTISPEKSANGPSLTRTVSPCSYSRRGLPRLGAASSPSSLTCRKFSTSRRGQRRRLGALADEAGHAGRVADDVPGVVVHLAAHQQVAREDLLLDDLLLAVLELDDVFHGDDDLVDPLLHVHRGDAGFEVLLDLLLVARLGVHDEPAAGTVVGALRLGPGLLEQLVGVDDLDLGAVVGLRRRRRQLGSGVVGVGRGGVEFRLGGLGGHLARGLVGGVGVSLLSKELMRR